MGGGLAILGLKNKGRFKICRIRLWGLDFDKGKAIIGIGKYQFSKFFQGIQRRVFYKGVGEKFRGVKTPSELWRWTYLPYCYCRFESGSGEPTVRAKRVRSSRLVGNF